MESFKLSRRLEPFMLNIILGRHENMEGSLLVALCDLANYKKISVETYEDPSKELNMS